MSVRIALMSDLHSNLPAAEAVLADIERHGAERVYHLGDLVGYCPWPNETIEFMRSNGIRCVRGNYDESVGENLPDCGCGYTDATLIRLAKISLDWTTSATTDANKAWLRSLPKEICEPAGDHGLWLVHGSPRRINEDIEADFPAETLLEFFSSGKGDILGCAHTHTPYHRQLGNYHVVNPGTAGKPKHGNPNAAYMLVDVGTAISASIIEVPYDYERTARQIAAAGLPEEFARMIRSGTARWD